jgi:Tol biopolymer transport system component
MELWIVNPDGTGSRQVGSSGASGHFMRWSADGRSVVYRTGGATSEMRSIPVDGGEATPFPKVAGGAHISFSPDRRLIMDSIGHKSMWITPVDGSPPRKVFEFDDPDIRIDYPVWSPDGAGVSFDRVAPQGGDVWLLEGLD